MKKVIICVLFFGILLPEFKVYSQSVWKSELANNGKIQVKSKISECSSLLCRSMPIVEYQAITSEKLSYQNCIKTMKDASKHTVFLDAKTSQRVINLSSNEWVNYYVFNAPWPFPPTDCVVRIQFTEDIQNKIAVFTIIAAPDLMKPTNLERFQLYSFTYTFKAIGIDNVEISVSAKIGLTVDVPLWLLRASMPDAAADPLLKLIDTIKN